MNIKQEVLLASHLSESICQLFIRSVNIRIPPYQRAYSWERKQCVQFLEDLFEQQGKSYYLGQLLFEKEGNTLYIIDGQQRLTTTILFLSAIAKIKTDRGQDIEAIRQTYLTDVFRTIDSDQSIFKKVTQKHLIPVITDTETISQRRIIEAFSFFEAELRQLEEMKIEQVAETLGNAVINTFYIASKIEATQVFEYQNNRGKELSRFEVIKAYLMHQIYLFSEDNLQANLDIAEIQAAISQSYRHIEAVEGYFTENELLDNYCSLYFNIRGSIEEVKGKLSKEADKIAWIKSFFEEFVEWTQSARNIVKSKNQPAIINLFFVGNNVNWKQVLTTIFKRSDNKGEVYNKILKLLEILSFKVKLGDYRSDNLPYFARRYHNEMDRYNINDLYQDIRNAAENGFQWYWNEGGRFRNIIASYFDVEKSHYKRNTIKFVLWQYENQLRIDSGSGALMDENQYHEYTIEHICPQNPAKEQYTETFKSNYLHLTGNLALLTLSQNAQFGNKSFAEKASLFQKTALLSYTEIRANSQWTESEIAERHRRLSDFAKKYFDTSIL